MNRRFSPEVASAGQLQAAQVRVMKAQEAATPAAGSDFVVPATHEALANMPAGSVLLTPNSFRGAKDLRAHINIHPDKAFAREASQNGVRFGQLVVADPDHRARVEYVALKPFGEVETAAREFGAISTVNALAAQRRMSASLEPIGFYRGWDDDRIAMLTRYEHSILTLDNLFWDPNFTPTERQARAALGHCALSLGELHRNGIAHGDPQVKNIAADNHGNRYVDLEEAQLLAPASIGVDVERINGLLEVDVRQCLESLNGQGIDFIGENFTVPYLEIISEPGSAVPRDALLRPEEIAHMTW